MLNIDCLCSIRQVCQMTKKNHRSNQYELLSPKIAESDPLVMGYVDFWWRYIPHVHIILDISLRLSNQDKLQNLFFSC
jgi:hypothetical protein